jgi:hypothetical protein
MSKIGSYKNTAFNESQKFLVLDPSTSSASLVLASELVAYITPQIGSVKAESTRLSAENTDYKIGEIIQTSGATIVGFLASVYLVVAGGDGDFPMLNGNDLLVIAGDDALREQLISEVAGQGASLVSMEGGPTVEAAVTAAEADILNRVIRVSSRTEMKAYDVPASYQFSLSEGSRSGLFAVKSGTPPTDTFEGIYVVLTNGNYAERFIDSPWSPGWFGITPVAADNSGAWQGLLNLNPAHVHYSNPGTYTFLSSSDHDQDISITGATGVVIDCTDAGYTGAYWTKFTGAFPQIENLGVAAVKGQRSVTFASAPTLSPGDVFVIYNPTDSSWSSFRTSYRAGEFCKVVSVAGNVVTIAGELYDDYAFAAVDVYRLDGVQVTVGGGFEINGNVSACLLNIEFGINCFVSEVKSNHKNNSIVFLNKCFNVGVNSPSFHNEGDGGDDYGISIANSQSIKTIGGFVYSRRHPTATGGDNAVGSVPCRDIRFTNMTLSNDVNSGTHCADFHGNTEDSTYTNCEIYGGATWQGKDNGYVNCRIGSLSIGVCILSAEIKGGTHYAKNCSLVTYINPDLSGRGVVEIGGNGGGITADTSEDATFEVIGGTLKGRNFSATTRLMYVRNRGTTHKVSAEFNGVAIDANNFGEVLLVLLALGTADSNGFIVDNLKSIGPKQGGKLATLTAVYAGFPLKMQKQTGSEIVTSSTGSPTISGTPVVFNWEYPKIPSAVVGRNDRGYFGNRIGVPYASSLDSAGISAAISTDDATNFASATTAKLQWVVSIDEI